MKQEPFDFSPNHGSRSNRQPNILQVVLGGLEHTHAELQHLQMFKELCNNEGDSEDSEDSEGSEDTLSISFSRMRSVTFSSAKRSAMLELRPNFAKNPTICKA